MSAIGDLMPQTQRRAAYIFLAIYAFVVIGPMFGLKPVDSVMAETIKNIAILLAGWLWGSSALNGKKDDTIAAQLPQPPKETP